MYSSIGPYCCCPGRDDPGDLQQRYPYIPYSEYAQADIPHTERIWRHVVGVQTKLDQQFAAFLKRCRAKQTYAQFAIKTGLTPSSLFRLENGEQSITLKRLGEVLKRLGKSPADVFDSSQQP